MTCAVFCDDINQASCSSYVSVLSERHCQVIENMQGLVRTDPSSPKAVKIWTSAPITTVVPHFLIFKGLLVADYSIDATTSPIITTYPTFPELNRPCGMYLKDKMTLVIKSQTNGVFYHWIHGHNEIIQLDESSNDPVADRGGGACAANPSSERLFFYSGGSSFTPGAKQRP